MFVSDAITAIAIGRFDQWQEDSANTDGEETRKFLFYGLHCLSVFCILVSADVIRAPRKRHNFAVETHAPFHLLFCRIDARQ